jgi:hypothetical protein
MTVQLGLLNKIRVSHLRKRNQVKQEGAAHKEQLIEKVQGQEHLALGVERKEQLATEMTLKSQLAQANPNRTLIKVVQQTMFQLMAELALADLEELKKQRIKVKLDNNQLLLILEVIKDQRDDSKILSIKLILIKIKDFNNIH